MAQRKERNWKDFNLKDFQEYYEKYYSGKTPGGVEKKDRNFYFAVWWRGFNKEIFKKRNRKIYKNWTKEDFKNHYNKNYKGKNRADIQEIDINFYQVARRRGFLDIIPLKGKSWKNFSLEDLQNYYNKNHKGKSPGEVQEQDSSFYSTIQRKNLLNKIHMNRKTKNWRDFKLKDFQDYYKKKFKGKTKSECQRENSNFYYAVWERGFLKQVFPPKQSGRRKKSLEKIV